MLKIDTHTHIMPKSLPDWSRKLGYGAFIHLEHHKEGAARMMQGDRFFREVQANCWDAEIRIEEYARSGVQVQVICTIPVLFAYWAKPEDTHDIARFLNDDVARTVQDHPRQYIGLGTLPMQDTELSLQELERCKAIGLHGIQIGSNINGYNLSEPRFNPIWEACERLGMCIPACTSGAGSPSMRVGHQTVLAMGQCLPAGCRPSCQSHAPRVKTGNRPSPGGGSNPRGRQTLIRVRERGARVEPRS